MKGRQIKYSDEELAFIKANKILPRRELHRLFCRAFEREDVSVEALKALCVRNGWKTGRTGCFEKGSVPHNKGVSFRPGGRSAQTQFKRGNRPANAVPVGAEVLTKDGYIKVKIAEPCAWQLKHRLVWEQHHGAVPPGHIVVFRNGDRADCDVANLECISRADNAVLNKLGLAQSPDEAQPAVQTILKVSRKIRDLKKKAPHAEMGRRA